MMSEIQAKEIINELKRIANALERISPPEQEEPKKTMSNILGPAPQSIMEEYVTRDDLKKMVTEGMAYRRYEQQQMNSTDEEEK